MAFQTWFLICSLCVVFLSASAAAQDKITDNPADQLVAVLNSNRTSNNASVLYSNPGLACLALQYIKAFQGDCGAVGDKKPADAAFAQTFAPNCGVGIASLTPITGRLLGCQTKYAKPADAFSHVLMENARSLEILDSKNHTEVGAAVSGSDGGSPYFWCVLFSNGTSNSSFVLEKGAPIITKPGCFSGANDVCSGAGANALSQTFVLLSVVMGALIVLFSAIEVLPF